MTPREILKQYWGYSAFRLLQEDIIRSVLEGQDTLALLPTGGGKSVCFQVPALCLKGICIVVSPLIALMKDQVAQLKRRGIKATAIFSGMSRREIDITLDNCIYGDFKLLYVSPERLKTELFLERARQMNISILAVDEAHCISQWGYDFRPSYLELVAFREELNIQRLIALTASATKEVKEDILLKLHLEMKDVKVYQQSSARKNLSYSVFKLESKERKLLEILQKVDGFSIVYVKSRKRTREISDLLNRNEIGSDFYHAGLSGKERSERQDAWIHGSKRVMVATNAFGMGIDKADVRTVIHMDMSNSLEAYYQEAGRAGRDGKKAYAVALYHDHNVNELKEQAEISIASVERIKRTYQALANYYKLAIGSSSFISFDFNFEHFIKTYNLPPLQTFSALKKLMGEGLIQLNEGIYEHSRISFIPDKSEVYKYQMANPKLDLLIKTILRLYGGEVFSTYVHIWEKDIASLMKKDEKQVKKWLAFLHDQHIIDYQYSSDSQRMTFLTPRRDSNKLLIDEKQIEWRRKLAGEKVQTVIKYLTSKECRTNILQQYFDEKLEHVCGICDNDLERKRNSDLPSYSKVKIALGSAKSLPELIAQFPEYAESQIISTIRLLMEDGIVVEKNGQFNLVK